MICKCSAKNNSNALIQKYKSTDLKVKKLQEDMNKGIVIVDKERSV